MIWSCSTPDATFGRAVLAPPARATGPCGLLGPDHGSSDLISLFPQLCKTLSKTAPVCPFSQQEHPTPALAAAPLICHLQG